jgi:hypothetical protein
LNTTDRLNDYDDHNSDYTIQSCLLIDELKDQRLLETDEKVKDYGMRIFTGSESLLRELKMSTPKESKNSAFKIMERESACAGSKKNLTSHNSMSSLIQLNP